MQKFLNAEETADKLVHSLEELYTEANYYSGAQKELNRDFPYQLTVSLLTW